MRTRLLIFAVVLAALVAPIRAVDPPDQQFMTITLPDKIVWQKAANQDVATLQGDPTKPGLYVQMLRWHAGYNSQPHSHLTDRYITVISGTWWLGGGAKYEPEKMYPAKAGTFVVHKAGEMHYDGAKDEDCVILIAGMGPVNAPRAAKGK